MKSYTDLEQSKKLAEILPLKSADMRYAPFGDTHPWLLEEMYYWNWGIGNNCVSYDKETGIVRIFYVFGHIVFVLPLSYVHELQHALRLCGIEKEIEL